jgi:hypothetical protein
MTECSPKFLRGSGYDIGHLSRVFLMDKIILALLTLGFAARLRGAADAADVYRYRSGWRSQVRRRLVPS